MSVTVKDIAKAAGVTHSAVSKVLNNRESFIGPETREKILKAAKELNYRPNYFARSLKKGKSHSIGLMSGMYIVDMGVDYYAAVSAGVERTMVETKSKYSLIMFGANYHETHEKSLELIEKGMVDGLLLILLSQEIARFEESLLPKLREYGLPFVGIHSLRKELPYHNVGMDSYRGGYLAGEHLVGLGYGSIGTYIGYAGNSPQMTEIMDGHRRALKDHGLDDADTPVFQPEGIDGGNTYHDAYVSIQKIKDLPRAVFAPNDEVAFGVIAGLRDRGIRVPEDVAVMGFNNDRTPRYFNNELTTVHHPVREKAAVALTMLTGILEGTRPQDGIQRELLQPRLVIRKTCGAGA